MRIFYSLLVMVACAILWMLPITEAIYDFQTDIQEDTFTSDTAAGVTTDNFTLTHVLYDNDTSSIDFLSSVNETPTASTLSLIHI